eukprot:COSAG01_NODE_27115_length_693_cov_52.202020_1_plen_58_part_10
MAFSLHSSDVRFSRLSMYSFLCDEVTVMLLAAAMATSPKQPQSPYPHSGSCSTFAVAD